MATCWQRCEETGLPCKGSGVEGSVTVKYILYSRYPLRCLPVVMAAVSRQPR